MRSLNLATRPFRNERLPNLLAVAALVSALLLSAYHVLRARDVMPDRTSDLNRRLAELEAESSRLRADAAGLRTEKPEARALAEWTQLKDLVDRRVFSWSGLFAVLEETLPSGVRLLSLSPRVEKGHVTLQMNAVARTFEEAMAFQSALEERPEFADVWPTTRAGADEPEYQYDMTYVPQPRKPAPASSAVPVPVPAVDGAASADARMAQ